MWQLLARRNRRRQGGNDCIARTGHIEHFASTGWQVQCLLIRTQQGHTVFASSDQQRAQIQLLHQLRTFGDQLRLVFTMPDDGFEFAEVRGNQAGASIDREVLALGVGEHRNATLAGGLDQRLMVFQRAFAVVGQDQHFDAVQQTVDFCAQCQRIGIEWFFEVDTQQLLMTTHDAQFDDGRLVGNTLKARPYTRRFQALPPRRHRSRRPAMQERRAPRCSGQRWQHHPDGPRSDRP